MKDGKMLCFKLKNGVHSSSVVLLVKTYPNQSETAVLLINEQQHTTIYIYKGAKINKVHKYPSRYSANSIWGGSRGGSVEPSKVRKKRKHFDHVKKGLC